MPRKKKYKMSSYKRKKIDFAKKAKTKRKKGKRRSSGDRGFWIRV
jgi:hypothetical protein